MNHLVSSRRSPRLRRYDYGAAGYYYVTICTQRRAFLFGDVRDGVMHENEFGAIMRSTWEGLRSHYPEVELDEFVVMPNHVHGIVVLGTQRAEHGARAGLRPAPTKATTEPDTTDACVRVAAGPTSAPANEMNGSPTDAPVRLAADPAPARAQESHDERSTRACVVVGAGLRPAGAQESHDERSPHACVVVGAGLRPARGLVEGARPVDSRPAAGLFEVVRAFKSLSARSITARRGTSGVAVWQRNYYEHVIRDDRALFEIRDYIAGNPRNWATDPENPHPATTR